MTLLIVPAGRVLETPPGLSYHTPRIPSSTNMSSGQPSLHQPRRWTPMPDSHTPTLNYLPLVWRGNRVSDINEKSRQAKDYRQSGNLEAAEKCYREALSGYERLLSPTHQTALDYLMSLQRFMLNKARCHRRTRSLIG